MKRACRLAIVLTTLLYPDFATAAPGQLVARHAENLVTNYAGAPESDPTDGISVACEDTSVESNDIVDASDVGIAVFGAQPAVQRSVVIPGDAGGYLAGRLRPSPPRSTMATSHTHHVHSTGEPVRPGYMPDGTPVYLLGYVRVSAAAGHVPIYLHGNAATGAHVLTRSPVSPPGYQLHGLVGYVPDG
jgi:hypothetical protein